MTAEQALGLLENIRLDYPRPIVFYQYCNFDGEGNLKEAEWVRKAG